MAQAPVRSFIVLIAAAATTAVWSAADLEDSSKSGDSAQAPGAMKRTEDHSLPNPSDEEAPHSHEPKASAASDPSSCL
jgi:hypothetical protein